jgi:hypothetical protein
MQCGEIFTDGYRISIIYSCGEIVDLLMINPVLQQRQWQQRMPFDGRGPPPMGFPHPGFRMPPPGPGMRPPFPGGPMPPHVRPTGGEVPELSPVEKEEVPPPEEEEGAPPAGGENDDDEVWRKRNRKSTEVSAALEKARQRREEEEKRMQNERKAGAAEKLRQLEKRMAAKKGDSPEKGSGRDTESPEHSDHEEEVVHRSSPGQRDRTISEESVEKEHRPPARSHHGGPQVRNVKLCS